MPLLRLGHLGHEGKGYAENMGCSCVQAKQGGEGSGVAESIAKERQKDAKPERIKAGFQVYQPGRAKRTAQSAGD